MRNELNRKLITQNNITKSNLIGLTPYKMDIIYSVDAYFYLKEEHLASFSIRKAYYKDIQK